MANETLTSSQSALVASEILSARSIVANVPEAVLLSLIHRDTIVGNTNVKKYTVEASLGAASGGTEGTAVANTFAFSMGTTVSATPTEGVLDLVEITEEALLNQYGIPFSDVDAVIRGFGSVQQYEAILAPYINRMVARGMRKMEADALALLSGLSGSVGTSGADLTVTNMLEAQLAYRNGEPLTPLGTTGPMGCRYLLTSQQKQDLDLALFATGSGAALSNLWTSQAQYSSGASAELGIAAQGQAGVFMGYPVHVYSPTLNVTANAGADVVGAFGCFGDPNRAPDDASLVGRPGAFAFVQRTPLAFAFDKGLEMRSLKVRMNARYICKEIVDSAAIKIVTDAP